MATEQVGVHNSAKLKSHNETAKIVYMLRTDYFVFFREPYRPWPASIKMVEMNPKIITLRRFEIVFWGFFIPCIIFALLFLSPINSNN